MWTSRLASLWTIPAEGDHWLRAAKSASGSCSWSSSWTCAHLMVMHKAHSSLSGSENSSWPSVASIWNQCKASLFLSVHNQGVVDPDKDLLSLSKPSRFKVNIWQPIPTNKEEKLALNQSEICCQNPLSALIICLNWAAGPVTICLQGITYLHLTRSEQSSLKRCFLEITECFCKLKYLYY